MDRCLWLWGWYWEAPLSDLYASCVVDSVQSVAKVSIDEEDVDAVLLSMEHAELVRG